MNTFQSDAFDSAARTQITATPVPENYRLAFLPRHFARYFMQAESAVFGHMSNLCPSYTGGYWEFLDLSNGGCYLAPGRGTYALVAPNGFDADVSGDVAGLIASLYAFSHLAFKYQATDIFSERITSSESSRSSMQSRGSSCPRSTDFWAQLAAELPAEESVVV